MKLVDRFVHQPKKLFLVDGLGAIISAFLLGIVLIKYQRIFGIPSSILYILATIPVFFSLYDLYHYMSKLSKTSSGLKVIAIMNLMYCCLSAILALYHYQEIKALGWIYIIAELTIVILLACLELGVSNKLKGHFKA